MKECDQYSGLDLNAEKTRQLKEGGNEGKGEDNKGKVSHNPAAIQQDVKDKIFGTITGIFLETTDSSKN